MDISIGALSPDVSDLLEGMTGHGVFVGRSVPSKERVLSATVDSAEVYALNKVADEIEPYLQQQYDALVAQEGMRPEGQYAGSTEAREAWDEKADELCEKFCEPFADYLSNDWLALYTIGSSLHDENGVRKWCEAFGQQIWAQLVYPYKKDLLGALSEIGIDEADIDALIERMKEQKRSSKKGSAMEGDPEDLDDICRRIIAHVGRGFDPLYIDDELMTATDTEEALAIGGIKRLGLTKADWPLLVNTGRSAVLNRLTALARQPEDATAPSPPPPPPGAVAPSPPPPGTDSETPGRGGKGERPAPPAVKPGVMPPEVLVLTKEHAGTTDEGVAKAIGVTRTTLNQYAKGKSEWKPDDVTKAALRDIIVRDANGLLRALSYIDGGDPMEVE